MTLVSPFTEPASLPGSGGDSRLGALMHRREFWLAWQLSTCRCDSSYSVRQKSMDRPSQAISGGWCPCRTRLLSSRFGIGYCMALFTRRRQALHDLIAGCV